MFSTNSEDTAFSLRVPDGVESFTYLDALIGLKRANDLTVIGIGEGAVGEGGLVDLNCPLDRPINAGVTLFYIGDERVDPSAIDWDAMIRATSKVAA